MTIFGLLVLLGVASDVLLTGFSAVDLLAVLSGLVLLASALPPVRRRLSSFRGVNAVLSHGILAALAVAVLIVPLAFTTGKGAQSSKNNVLNQSKTLAAQGRYDEAYALLAGFEGAEGIPEILQNMAAVEIMRGNPAQAEALIGEAGMYQSMDANMYYNLGLCGFQQQYYLDSIVNFENAARLAPDFWQAYYYEAEAYFVKNNDRSAAYFYRQALEIAPDRPELYCRLAAVELETMDYLDAKQLLETAETLHPNGDTAEQISQLKESIAFYTDGAAGSRR